MTTKKENRICKECGEYFVANSSRSNTCLFCRNIKKAMNETGFSEKGKAKIIKLSNGIEVLNNAAGKEVAFGG